jgi:hypothetical protein
MGSVPKTNSHWLYNTTGDKMKEKLVAMEEHAIIATPHRPFYFLYKVVQLKMPSA